MLRSLLVAAALFVGAEAADNAVIKWNAGASCNGTQTSVSTPPSLCNLVPSAVSTGAGDNVVVPSSYRVVCNSGDQKNTGTIQFCSDSTCTSCSSQSFNDNACISNPAFFGAQSLSVDCPEDVSGAGQATTASAVAAGLAAAAAALFL